MDVIPGDVNYLTFTPTAVGEYILQCTEYCGPGHSYMRGYVNVVEA
jgi:cytochrome c oxidase subunit 2